MWPAGDCGNKMTVCVQQTSMEMEIGDRRWKWIMIRRSINMLWEWEISFSRILRNSNSFVQKFFGAEF